MSIVADGVKVLVFRTTGASDTKSNNHARCRSVASGSLGSCESAASRRPGRSSNKMPALSCATTVWRPALPRSSKDALGILAARFRMAVTHAAAR